MRFEKFISENRIDEALLYNQAKSLDDIVLGENTWFFLRHPVLEDYYYDVSDGLNEDEIHHFSIANKLLLEKKLENPKEDPEIARLEKEIAKIEKENKADDTWFADDEGVGFRNKNWEKRLEKDKGKKAQSWSGNKRKDKEEHQEWLKKMSQEDLEVLRKSKQLSKWDKDVEEVYRDISKKARNAFHKLDDLGKKSFIVKYILHGLEATKEEGWGRLAQTAKDKDKRIASDRLESYEEQQKFTKDVLKMFKAEQEMKKEGAAKKVQLLRRYKDAAGIEMALAKSNDKTTVSLLEKVKDLLKRGAFKDDGGAGYMEMLFKIASKEYGSVKELTDCAKQWKAYAPNIKTYKNIDITTICPKRQQLKDMEVEYAKAAQKYLDAIKNGATGAQKAELKRDMESRKVTAANNPTCAYCYVELGREGGATFLAKAEKSGQTYQDEFADWIQKDKKGNPVKDDDGNYVVKGAGKDTRDALNKMGGLRFFGSSDYTENSHTDAQIERIIKDAAKVGLQLKAITKQRKFVQKYGGRTFEEGPLKGKPVFNINMSVDEVLGFPLVDAIRIKKQYPGNVNIRVVARNPKEAASYSKVREVDVITLLHFKGRGERLKNKELYVNMSPGTKGWKMAIEAIKKEHPRENWNKIFTKICCNMDGKGDCRKCPNACGFNPTRVADYVQKAKGGKMKLTVSGDIKKKGK